MIPRGKLSISTINLFTALFYCFSNKRYDQLTPIKHSFGDSIFCLSARTGLNLTLHALNFEPGSQIVVCDINIPDMFTIIHAHQLECEPISMNKHTMAMNVVEIENAITPRTKAILITHLFGARAEMENIISLAKKYNLIVIEDCAQAFNHRYRGHPNSDVSLFSFGLIKTNTCLTGGLICFNNQPLFEKVKLLNMQLPVQETKLYLAKIFKAFIIKIITLNWMYTSLYHIANFFKADFDEVMARFTKGFPGSNVFEKISFRPCSANLRLLQKRIGSPNDGMIKMRKEIALQIVEQIPVQMRIGSLNTTHTYWVLAVECENPLALIVYLRENGIDATRKASSLISIIDYFNFFNGEQLTLRNLVYLPIHRDVVRKLRFLDLSKHG